MRRCSARTHQMRSLIFAALALSAAASTPLAAHHPGGALQLRGGYDGGGGYGGGGYGDDIGYGARGRGGGGGYRGYRRGRGRRFNSGPPDGPIDELKVYVGGISWNIDDQGLLDAFSQFGQCEATIMKDKYTGRSRGFGFVTYQSAEECTRAIEEMNGKELDGRAITCNNARQTTYDKAPVEGAGEGGGGGDGGGGGGGGEEMAGDE